MTQPEPKLEHDKPLLCVDRATGLIYEAKLLEGYALCRPATPFLYSRIERVPLNSFWDRFDEFYGNPEEVRAFAVNGRPTAFTAETKH